VFRPLGVVRNRERGADDGVTLGAVGFEAGDALVVCVRP
jgi:hypothetical protein